jgi:hypothetical protein
MRHFGYLVVEGQHDIAFVGELLKTFQFQRLPYKNQVDKFWEKLIPTTFPNEKGDLLKRVHVPAFFETPTHSIAINTAEGDTKLVETLHETYTLLPHSEQVSSYGIFLDADKKLLPQARHNILTSEIKRLLPLTFPLQPGKVTASKPFCGIYVLPDNQQLGTLEDILLECAEANYAGLKSTAQQYLDTVDLNALQKDDKEELRKPAGRKKAHIGSIASVLKPGKTIQVSIQDNRWLAGAALDLPMVKSVRNFLAQLLKLDVP